MNRSNSSLISRVSIVAAAVTVLAAIGCRPHDGDPSVKETDRRTMHPEGQREATADQGADAGNRSNPDSELTSRPGEASGGTQAPGGEPDANVREGQK